MGNGLRGLNGNPGVPPYSNGPYEWDQELQFKNATKLRFRDSDLYINSSSDGQLDITADTTVALSGAVTADSTLTVTGNSTFNAKVDVGTYSSMTSADTGSTTELVSVGLEGSDDQFHIGVGAYVRATGEDGKPFGLTTTVETTDTTGINKIQGVQGIALLGTSGGTEAAVLKTLGGDATAGMYGGWFKIGANSNCQTNSGSRAAAIWVDNQMSGTVNGEEYGIFATTGASKPKALIGLETSSSGWENFLSLDETMDTPVEPLATDTVTGGTQNRYLKVDINGTAYAIALYTGW